MKPQVALKQSVSFFRKSRYLERTVLFGKRCAIGKESHYFGEAALSKKGPHPSALLNSENTPCFEKAWWAGRFP